MPQETRRRGDTETRRRSFPASSRPRVFASLSRPRRGDGFTLIELMVVIFIIVLGMTLAIPAIRALTGSRSLEATENSLSSFINFARTEAIGFQRTEGVIFLLDTGADRVKCAFIMDTGIQNPLTDVPGVTYLDLVPDHDPLFLPTGVRVWTMKDTPPTAMVLALQGQNVNPVDPFPGCRYLGFNPSASDPGGGSAYGMSAATPLNGYAPAAVLGGVILFDKNGHLVTPRYGLRLNPNSQLGQILSPNAAATGGAGLVDWPSTGGGGSPSNGPNVYLTSQTGMVLFDRESFLAQADPGSQKQFSECNDSTSGSSLEKAMENWLDYGDTAGNGGGGTGGALFVFVNRYDGNLIPAE